MKFIKIFIFCFILLILSSGIVCAEDNATSADMDGSGELISDYNYTITAKNFSDTQLGTIRVEGMPDDASGNISISVDENEVYNQKVSIRGNYLILNELNLDDGIHSSLIKYSGDSKYAGFAENRTFEKTFLTLSLEDEDYVGEVQLRSSDSCVFYVNVDGGVTGRFKAYVDNKLVLDQKIDNGEERGYEVYVKDISYGLHSYEVTYTGGNHKNQVRKGMFNVSYYFNVIAFDDMNISIGDKVEFAVGTDEDEKVYYNVSVNGKSKEYSSEFVELSDFKLGENIVEFSCMHNSYVKTIPFKVNVSPVLKVPTTLYYQKPDNIVLIVDEYTRAKLDIKIDGEDYKTADINNTKTLIMLDNLSLGKHVLTINCTQENLINACSYSINVLPNIPTKFRVNELNNLTFIAPEEINGNLKITGIVNEDVEVKNGSAVIPIGNLEPGNYKLNITYENTTWQYCLTVYSTGPDWEMEINHRTKIHKYEWMTEIESQDFGFTILNAPEEISGTFTFYHDGEYQFDVIAPLFDKTYAVPPKFNETGNHTVTIAYSGDDYFNPCNKSFNYTITEFMDVYFENNCVYAVLPYDATGTITVKVNGKKFDSETLKADDEDFEYGIMHHYFNLQTLEKDKTYDVEVIYKGNYGKLTIKQKFNKEVNIRLIEKSFEYNQDDELEFIMTTGLKKKATVTVDGEKFAYDRSYDRCYVDISKLKPGIHNIMIYYPGDSLNPSKTFNDTFLIKAKISNPSSYEYSLNSKIKVSIDLPGDATGDLIVEINGSPYNSTALKDGKATILLPSKELGDYEYFAYYRGNYEVPSVRNKMSIVPKLKHTGNSKYPQNGTVTVDMGGDGNATLVIFAECIPIAEFEINGKDTIIIDKEILDKTKIIAKTYASNSIISSDYYVTLDFEAVLYINNTESTSKFWYTSYTKKIDADNIKMTYNDGTVYKIKAYGLFGDVVGSGEKITVKIGSKKYKLKTNSKGIASFKIKEAPGKYNIRIDYGELVATKKITVKHALSLNNVKVKKSAKKLVLTAKLNKKLKGKKITFKFNGKKYVAKTNKKGIAKVTVKSNVLKNLKVGKKVKYQATYLKDTVKKSVKVKY